MHGTEARETHRNPHEAPGAFSIQVAPALANFMKPIRNHHVPDKALSTLHPFHVWKLDITLDLLQLRKTQLTLEGFRTPTVMKHS